MHRMHHPIEAVRDIDAFGDSSVSELFASAVLVSILIVIASSSRLTVRAHARTWMTAFCAHREPARLPLVFDSDLLCML